MISKPWVRASGMCGYERSSPGCWMEDPSPTSADLHVTQTDTTQLWVGDTDVYVLFFPTDDNHVMLIKAVNLLDELG